MVTLLIVFKWKRSAFWMRSNWQLPTHEGINGFVTHIDATKVSNGFVSQSRNRAHKLFRFIQWIHFFNILFYFSFCKRKSRVLNWRIQTVVRMLHSKNSCHKKMAAYLMKLVKSLEIHFTPIPLKKNHSYSRNGCMCMHNSRHVHSHIHPRFKWRFPSLISKRCLC